MWTEQQKNGKFKFIERYTDYMTGETKRVSVTLEKDTAKTRKQAFDILQQKIDSAAAEIYTKELKLRELVDFYRKEQIRTVKKSTCTRNFHACNTLMKILGAETIVNNLTAGYIRQRMLSTGKDMGTLNEHLTRLKALLRWGYRNDLINDIGYLEKLERFKDIPHNQKIQDKFLESDELKKILSVMRIPKWKYLTEFLALSGLRFGEAAALLSSDIDLKSREIHVTKNYDSIHDEVTTPKTSCSIRDVYIQDELVPICKIILNQSKVDRTVLNINRQSLFICTENGAHINFYAYNKYLRENSLSAIQRGITPHTLRHTHASLLMEQGVNIETISRRLGHENSKITMEIYLHVTKKLKEKENENMKKVKIL